jgi:hypothetical protein
MSENQKDDQPRAEEAQDEATNEVTQTKAQFFEEDDYADEVRDSSRASQQQPLIIYAELVKGFSPYPLLKGDYLRKAAGHRRSAEAASPDHLEIINILGQGWERTELSFLSTLEEIPERIRFVNFYFEPNTDVKSVSQKLNEHSKIVRAVPAPVLIPPSTPSDDPFKEPFLKNGGGGIGHDPCANQWYIFRCGIDLAWNANPKSGFVSGKGVVIADIDWGFRTSHRDFKDRIKFTHNVINGTDEVSGGDGDSHGTAVLGLAGAAASNQLGIAGVAFGADLWAIKAGEDPLGQVEIDYWLKAIDCVRKRESPGKRKIILLEVETLRDENIEIVPQISAVIEAAIASGIVVCVAAGNGSRDAGKDYGGESFPPTGSIVVGATEQGKENPLHIRSNYGLRVTVYAPGSEKCDLTCSSHDDDCYRKGFGRTSGALPKVGGTVALMLEVNPKLSHYEIKDILRETGVPISQTADRPAGIFLNADAAVREALRRAK